MSYSLWISGLEPVCILSDMLILQSMNEVTLDTLKSLYSDQIADALSHASGVNLRPMFICGDERPKYEKLMAEKKRRSESLLDPRFTFDTFVIGGSNNIAYAAAKAVAAQPAKAFNPLYIYGDVGLGKTHLMHAIGNKIKEDNPSARITYVTSETFTNELIQSIQDNTNAQFRNKYRNVDVLMIDDVQFIAGKNTTQEEFFNTFNTLHTSGRQIVISSDKPPKEIPALEERLRSRFEGGLITDIQSPDYETRMAILQKKADQENIIIDPRVLSLIATRPTPTYASWKGALHPGGGLLKAHGTPITFPWRIRIEGHNRGRAGAPRDRAHGSAGGGGFLQRIRRRHDLLPPHGRRDVPPAGGHVPLPGNDRPFPEGYRRAVRRQELFHHYLSLQQD